ncbi:MAG: SWIM zinc finger family protein, partial [Pseudomonas helleri]
MNPRLTKPLAPTWVSRFKEQSLERGRRYARENRVRIAQIGDSLITASCQGSGDNTYRQTIQLRESAKGTLLLVSANCTCPVRTNCKHTAAVLLKIEDTLNYPAAAQD